MKIVMVTMTKEETLVVLVEAKESVDDASNETDQVMRKFAINAINVTALFALITAKMLCEKFAK